VALCLGVIAYLLIALRRSRSDLEKSLKDRKLDISAQEVLHDITRDGALVRIERVNPDNLFMWRPR